MKFKIKIVIGLVWLVVIDYAPLYSMEDSILRDSIIVESKEGMHRIIENEEEDEIIPTDQHGRVYNFFNKNTRFVDTILSKPLADLPGLHAAYNKYPLSTKIGLIALVSYVVLSNSHVKKFFGKIKNCVAQIMGIVNEDDDEDDDDDEANPYKPHKLIGNHHKQPLPINKK